MYVFYDAHLMDTFFDAGADVNVGLIACSVATKWAWTATVSWSTSLAKDVSGHCCFTSQHTDEIVFGISENCESI